MCKAIFSANVLTSNLPKINVIWYLFKNIIIPVEFLEIGLWALAINLCNAIRLWVFFKGVMPSFFFYFCTEFGIPIACAINKDDALFLNNDIILWVFKYIYIYNLTNEKAILFYFIFSILEQQIKKFSGIKRCINNDTHWKESNMVAIKKHHFFTTCYVSFT